MPIYYGCTNISEFFPPEFFVSIDINDPDAIEKIQETIASDLWIKNQNAIAYARLLILERYQFFPFLAQEIQAHERSVRENIIPNGLQSLIDYIHQLLKKYVCEHFQYLAILADCYQNYQLVELDYKNL
jgi:hypothetical protein